MATRSINYDAAVRLLQQPGHVLVKTFERRGCEFSIVGERGGRVTEITGRRLLARDDCHPVDPGLLPDSGQSFSLHCLEM